MRFKDLFRVPKGEKVTEKHLRRVLAASICSILLCMSCLLGTTWAWFSVSIENTGNVIRIGPDVMLIEMLPDGSTNVINSGDPLSEGQHEIAVVRLGKNDSFQQQRRTVYLTLTLHDGTNSVGGYMVLDNDNETAIVYAGANEQLFWSVSWDKPTNNEVLMENGTPLAIISLAVEEPTEPTEETTSPTEDPAQSTEDPAQSTEDPAQSTEDPTQSTENPTQPTGETTSGTGNTENTEDPSQNATGSEAEA